MKDFWECLLCLCLCSHQVCVCLKWCSSKIPRGAFGPSWMIRIASEHHLRCINETRLIKQCGKLINSSNMSLSLPTHTCSPLTLLRGTFNYLSIWLKNGFDWFQILKSVVHRQKCNFIFLFRFVMAHGVATHQWAVMCACTHIHMSTHTFLFTYWFKSLLQFGFNSCYYNCVFQIIHKLCFCHLNTLLNHSTS